MNAQVMYNEDGEPCRINVSDGYSRGQELSLAVRGSSAIAQTVTPPEGQEEVYIDEVSRLLAYVEELPFVQAVTLDEYTGGPDV